MRTSRLAIATVLAATALSVQAGPRMESALSPFTYEALGATPTVTLGRARAARAAEAPLPAASAAAGRPRAAAAAQPAAGTIGTTTFTYDPLGATPQVGVRQPVKSEAQAPAAAH